MTPERWRQIEDIFNEASELDDAERSKFIENVAGNDADLKTEVEQLYRNTKMQVVL